MTATQQAFIENMTPAQARAVLSKFRDDPAVALAKSEAAFCAFRAAYEIANPGEYIQRANMADGVQFNYDYLVTTMKRLVSEAGHAPGNHSERDYHFWLEGCSERLCERLEQKASRARKASEKKAQYEKAKTSHPAYAGNGRALVLSDVYGSEEDSNQDMAYGYEPGTTARQRREAEERVAKRDAAYAEFIKQGVEEIEAYYRAAGYEAERAKTMAAEYHKRRAEEEKREARNDKRRTGGRGSSWTRQDQRKHEKRNSSSYQAGSRAGADIGLDPQVGRKKQERIG